MNVCSIDFAGQELHLHGEKFLWIPGERILCAADIHFEKGTFFDRFGTFLPPYDSEETLSILEHWIHHFNPRIFIALGDSFHDAKAGERLSPEILVRLNALIGHVSEWIWVTGNHDPDIHPQIPGTRMEEYTWNNIYFRHEYETSKEDAEISGHFHPKARLMLRGSPLSAPCFVRRKNRLVMPSFGKYTGGLFVHDAAFLPIIPADEHRRLYMAYKGDIFPLAV